MVPPFIAYYGALKGGHKGKSLLQTVCEQVKLYREVLFDRDVGLWRHIVLSEGTDQRTGERGTGGLRLPLAGALRVLAMIQRLSMAESMKWQQKDLVCWVRETLDGMRKFQVCGVVIFLWVVTVSDEIPFLASEWHVAELH